ncbi:ankyrin repeat-containing protein [Cavenderia fasciculata]|uniref:Ankyrin repeat-containing protein n=1 Tax=Cavenderia fasciculata TaxID=261658 RepID=F4Q3H4_CACFS|nr:ankyrin repeat-containing protein [Cavenderia fasciculata]EGG16843.1 ankyrin repeat-containing protein [Cavenderia fasciculata]|eukprot:XP_004355317.1 ankyrin repeat-containing protein [Cavenderia fasciculata]
MNSNQKIIRSTKDLTFVDHFEKIIAIIAFFAISSVSGDWEVVHKFTKKHFSEKNMEQTISGMCQLERPDVQPSCHQMATQVSSFVNCVNKGILAEPCCIERMLEKYDYELLRSVGSNDIKKLREMIDCGVDINMREYDKGTTPLHIAAARGHKQALELLVSRGADVNAQDNRGIAPLHSLVTNRYDVLALWMIRHGANIHLQDINKYSPFDLAQGWFQKEMVAASEGKPTVSDEAAPTTDIIKITQSSSTSSSSLSLPTPSGPSSEVLKVYYRGESYKSVKVLSTETARDVCKRMCEKFNMNAYDKCFDIIEIIKGEGKPKKINININHLNYSNISICVVRYLQGNEYLLTNKSKWPIIVGNTGNETHLHCHFSITIRKSAPTEAQELFSRIF